MKKKKITIDDVFEAVTNGFTSMEDRMATKEDLKAFATKKDLFELESRITEKMATKDGLRDLENKLIEDTGAMTGVEQTHHRSITQRVARLEKEVFQKTA